MNKFNERLKELRIEKGLSQNQLAKQLNLSDVAICLWEQNKRVPNLDAVIAIADFFGVSIDFLAGRED